MNLFQKVLDWLFIRLTVREDNFNSLVQSTEFLLQVFYMLCFILIGMSISAYGLNPRWSDLMLWESRFTPLWPLRWISVFKLDYVTSVNSIIGFSVISTLLGAAFWRRNFGFRILVFLGVLQYTALTNSFGKINHGFHALTIASGLFACIPQSCFAKNLNFSIAKELLSSLIGVQLFIVGGYTCSGFVKGLALLEQWWKGVPFALSPDGLSYQVSTALVSQPHPLPLGSWFHDATGLLPIVLLLSAYCIEFFALPLYLLWPHYLKYYGVLLISLHVFAASLLGPDFTQHTLIVGCVLVLSPFGRGEKNAKILV